MTNDPTVLVVAKAPEPGLVKTRVAATVGDDAAAQLAAAALLDTLETVAALGWPVVVALTGELGDAVRTDEITRALSGVRVVSQRGDGLGARLAHAHADADGGHGVVQVGMDTPQLTVRDYLDAGAEVRRGSRVIGPAVDGGWWLLGLPDPGEAAVLADVEMSVDDTAEHTERALGDVERLRTVRDMDTWADALDIADGIPLSRVAAVVQSLRVNS
ncbi:hypothetical protein ASC61_03900 [Aeromicrobium sp. Root344]|uniref:TIGR04282 family arsenosugar biosynthesis glycosyltransferase n=1 Tax=Aeromicrobium sp. Root344 TaxID=1736521 RepID=UPI0006FD3ADB|nr:DUF2064 domain-containing protein [Aeromicrobium sp. Root344]KQV74217.1 hypothetical protein ASC61_03900 [Aeromicrobium sp. Root344]